MKYRKAWHPDELGSSRVSSLLRTMVQFFDELSARCGVEATVRRVLEPPSGKPNIYQAGRGVDFEDEYKGKNKYTAAQRTYILEQVNKRFPRSDGRKTIEWHRGERYWELTHDSDGKQKDTSNLNIDPRDYPYFFTIRVAADFRAYAPEQKSDKIETNLTEGARA